MTEIYRIAKEVYEHRSKLADSLLYRFMIENKISLKDAIKNGRIENQSTDSKCSYIYEDKKVFDIWIDFENGHAIIKHTYFGLNS